jgi:hypothetical protein
MFPHLDILNNLKGWFITKWSKSYHLHDDLNEKTNCEDGACCCHRPLCINLVKVWRCFCVDGFCILRNISLFLAVKYLEIFQYYQTYIHVKYNKVLLESLESSISFLSSGSHLTLSKKLFARTRTATNLLKYRCWTIS